MLQLHICCNLHVNIGTLLKIIFEHFSMSFLPVAVGLAFRDIQRFSFDGRESVAV